jgi:hypothetical protein
MGRISSRRNEAAGETRGIFKKIVGKIFPRAGELRRTTALELFAVDGTRVPRPQHEERLWVSVEKNEVAVVFRVVALPPPAGSGKPD